MQTMQSKPDNPRTALVNEEYLWALETLAETTRNRRATRSDYKQARRIVGETERVTSKNKRSRVNGDD